MPTVAAPNVAREVVLAAGLPKNIHATTVMRACASSTEATTNAGNAIATLAANTTGDISYRDTDGFAIGTVNTAGVSSTGNVTLNAGAAVTQTAAISAAGLELLDNPAIRAVEQFVQTGYPTDAAAIRANFMKSRRPNSESSSAPASQGDLSLGSMRASLARGKRTFLPETGSAANAATTDSAR